MKLAYGKADRIVAVSKSIKRVLEENLNIQSEKIETIYNPVAINTVITKSRYEVRHPFIRNENGQIIISVGRLEEQKRFDILLKAFSLVKKKLEKVHLIILGRGELRNELEELAINLNLNKWIDFVGFKSNPYAWMAKADIFVLSSDFEGFPNVLLEAMACGVPVISTDCPSGPSEIITNGKSGILIPPGNAKALADAMLTLLKNENLRKVLSEEGRKRIEDFRIEKILLRYEELF